MSLSLSSSFLPPFPGVLSIPAIQNESVTSQTINPRGKPGEEETQSPLSLLVINKIAKFGQRVLKKIY
jgi:hypothetical protein